MASKKISVTLPSDLVERMDRLVRTGAFPNRSHATERALREKIARIRRTRLARACRKLDPAFEQALAERGLTGELSQWPEYRP